MSWISTAIAQKVPNNNMTTHNNQLCENVILIDMNNNNYNILLNLTIISNNNHEGVEIQQVNVNGVTIRGYFIGNATR